MLTKCLVKLGLVFVSDLKTDVFDFVIGKDHYLGRFFDPFVGNVLAERHAYFLLE